MFPCKDRLLSCFVAIICVLGSSCSSREGEGVPLYPIVRMDYEDVLTIEGQTVPISTVNINCPPDVNGTIVSIIDNGTAVKKGDVVCVIEDPGISNNFDNWTRNLESTQAELEKLLASQRLDSALLDAQVKNNDVETLIADADSLQMVYMSPIERRIQELQLERARIERAQLLKQVEATKIMQRADVLKIERQIAQIERRLETEREKMESLVLRAPQDGIVVRARRRVWRDETWNIGDDVWNGRTIVTIPDFDSVKVVIQAPEAEYKRLNLGDSVMFTFDAMPDNRAWGRISKLASIGQTRSQDSQVKTFEVEASVDSMIAPIELGLSVKCHIYISHIPDTIVVPTVCIFDKDSTKVVYVQKGRKFEEREVALGIGSSKSSVVERGLNEGDRIMMLNPKNLSD